MSKDHKPIRSAVRRYHAEDYMLTSLVAFCITVVFIRVGLQLTGFPQIGNDILHIAHALWGGLLLFIAVLLPLALANRWAIKASAYLSGIGIGLFIDEVGKFITQTNDYFFPPSLSLIYGFFLLNVFVYLYFFRQPHEKDPRKAMYRAFEGLQDALDGDLDAEEATQIEAQLSIAKESDRDEIVSLANAISNYLNKEKQYLAEAEPSYWKRVLKQADSLGRRLGRNTHRTIISVFLTLWLIFVMGYITVLLQGGANLDSQVLQWRGVLIAIQFAVGGLMIVAVYAWITKNEERGLKFGVWGFLLSLVALQTLYFYLSQFSAIISTIIQFTFLEILLAYRRWYLSDGSR